MKTVSGIFASRDAAARGIQRLRGIGVRDDAINVLAPGMSERQNAASAYAETGHDFATDEPIYRRGFEAALLPFVRGRGYDVVLVELHRMYPDVCQTDAFRCGFERGQMWDESRRRPEDRAA